MLFAEFGLFCSLVFGNADHPRTGSIEISFQLRERNRFFGAAGCIGLGKKNTTTGPLASARAKEPSSVVMLKFGALSPSLSIFHVLSY